MRANTSLHSELIQSLLSASVWVFRRREETLRRIVSSIDMVSFSTVEMEMSTVLARGKDTLMNQLQTVVL